MLKLQGNIKNSRTEWELTEGTHIVGRKTDCDIFIPYSTISRKHFQLEITADDKCIITDLGSQNGTMVNSVKITEPKELKAGDRIILGEVLLMITDSENTSIPDEMVDSSFSRNEPEKSVMIPIKDILKPLQSKVTERPEVLRTFFEMAKMLVMSDPKEVMLEKSLELISKVIPTDRLAVIMTKEDDLGEEDFYISASKTSKTTNNKLGELNLSKTIINKIIADKTAFYVSDLLNDPQLAQQQSIIRSQLKSAMAVPLFDEGEVLGVLYADTSNPAHHYNEQYLNLLASAGNILASRLNNYKFLEMRAEQQIIEAEVKRASAIQRKLLQIPHPFIPGYNMSTFQTQCRAVGGDLYDMCNLPGGNLLFLVADVSGKGMGAALLMANILASFRILYKLDSMDLHQAVTQVSTQLFEYSAPEDFATLFIGQLNHETHTLEYINAGHNPPVLTHADQSYDILKASGIMIGALPLMEWEIHQIVLQPGDFLTIFSDGVTEAESADGMYGEERLEKFLQKCCNMDAAKTTMELVRDIESFTGDTPQSDDVTLMILKRE